MMDSPDGASSLRAKRTNPALARRKESWIASSQGLLAMTASLRRCELIPASAFESALRRCRRPWLGLRRALGLHRHRGFADHFDQRPQRVLDARAGDARNQERRLLGGALQAVLLRLQFFRRHAVDLVSRDDLDLVGE